MKDQEDVVKRVIEFIESSQIPITLQSRLKDKLSFQPHLFQR